MFAIFKTGGKQYRVEPGQKVKVEKIEKGLGESIAFEEVLLLHKEGQTQVGEPRVGGAKVLAEVCAQGRHKKVHVLKFKRRKHHMKQQGHRQYFTEIKVTAIEG